MSDNGQQTETATFADLTEQASPAERVVQICIDGELYAEHERLEMELETARQVDLSNSRLNGGGQARDVAQQVRDLEERMRGATRWFRLRAVPPKEWSDLMAKHPDPAGRLRFDPAAFAVPAIAACCVEPTGDEAAVRAFLAKAPHAQQPLFDAAWQVNNEAGGVPFSVSASSVLQAYETNSTTAGRLGSPAASSSVA